MAEIIRVRDPRGIEVRCEETEWQNHIVLNHGMMLGNEQAVVETIKQPKAIYESSSSSPPMDYREVYCKETPTATYYSKGMPYTKVVVSVLGGTGEVITAYPAKRETGGTIGEAIYYDDEQD